ncbi:hypothetical protein ACIQU6_41420 [Streptomyces sp. NPDC090442]|uniref:hypothetical protein n=1 Tax=Streptomyces sp. NPDC090442 TaxID=3365962 RepID=UPI0037FF0AB2
MKLDASRAAQTLRTLLTAADRLHPAALLALVLLFAGLVYVAAPVAVQFMTALVTGTQAAALLACAGLLLRLAYRTAAAYSTRRAGVTA